MAQTKAARAIIVDPSRLFREGIRDCLRRGGYSLLGEAQNADAAKKLLDTFAPDLALVGGTFAEDESLAVCRALRRRSPKLKIILTTEYGDDPLFQVDAVAAGVDALLRRTVGYEECWGAIEKVTTGKVLFPREILRAAFQPIKLTERERQVLQLWAEGKSDREIAGIFSVRFDTVRTHARNMLQKLQVHERREAVRRARRRGLI
jgi:DNA-binding NarL/FixJ family response regulator